MLVATFWLLITGLHQLMELTCSGAPLLSKFGNLSIQEILVVTSAYARTPVRTESVGGGGESQDNPTGSGEYHLFLAGNFAVLLGNRGFFGGKSYDHRRFSKRGVLKSFSSLFTKTIVRQLLKF